MNILVVYGKPFPPQIRIENEMRSLIRDGHKFIVLATSVQGKKDEELYNGIKIYRISRFKSKHTLMNKINLLIKGITYLDYHLLHNISHIVKKYEIDLIHVVNLPLVKTSLIAARRHNIPIIADLHENWPAAVQEYLSKNSIINILRKKTIDKHSRWAAHERKMLNQVDSVIVVIEEASERFINYGIDLDKVHVIPNTEDISYFMGIGINKDIAHQYNNNFVISYIGSMGSHRGIECTIKAIRHLIRTIPNIKLLLVGSPEAQILEYKRLAVKIGVEDYVIFTGNRPFEEIPSYIEASDICLVPHNYNEHTNTTVPHKLFQYMLMGKPVIVSNCRPLKRIIEEVSCGLVFEANNDKDLADKILTLHNNESLRTTFGINGKEAVMNKYNWEISGNTLCDIYRGIER